jgi:hypothetical protein
VNRLNSRRSIIIVLMDLFVKHSNAMNNQVVYRANFFFISSLFQLLDNHEMAILLYKKGLRELEKAVNLNIDSTGKRDV